MMSLLCCKVERLQIADSQENAWRFLTITHQQTTLGVLATRPWGRECIGHPGLLPLAPQSLVAERVGALGSLGDVALSICDVYFAPAERTFFGDAANVSSGDQ